MTDDNWKTLRVPADAWETAKAQKEDDDRTWGEQIVRGDNPTTTDIDAERLASLIVDQIGAEAGGAKVDDSEIAKEVAQRLDYTNIADKVSEQVIRELRQ